MPRSQQESAGPTPVLDIFHAPHKVRDATEQTGEEAEAEGPRATNAHPSQLKWTGITQLSSDGEN